MKAILWKLLCEIGALLGLIGGLLCLSIGLYYGFQDDHARGVYFLLIGYMSTRTFEKRRSP